MKIALGMIVRGFTSPTRLMGFIGNAEKYGHKLDCVIVAHSRPHDAQVESKIREILPLHTINIRYPEYCIEELGKRGVSEKAALTLLKCPIDTERGLVPYGHNRTLVVMEAILRGADVLIFVDSDVISYVLTKTPEGPVLKEIDFFGSHLEHLENGADVTTGEYSGYNILPPASFNGMGDLLYGVKKGDMFDYWHNSSEHRSLVYQPEKTVAKPCKKILGGNLAIRLSAFNKLPPFFSSFYTSSDEVFLCRGEDTVLGFEIASLGTKCIDIGVYPLHDTYDDYPAEPDLQNDRRVQERFFYACTGWVGRNPFFNHILGKDPKSTREFQREHLAKGIPELVKYTSNPMFNRVQECFDDSWNSLDKYVGEFNSVIEAWDEFKRAVF